MKTPLDANEMSHELYDAIVQNNLNFFQENKHIHDTLRMKKTNGENNGIHIAVQYESHDIVQMFLEKSPKNELICEKNSKGNTPLHIAAEVGNFSIVKLLYKYLEKLSSSIHMNGDNRDEQKPWRLKNLEGNTPVHVAIIKQNLEIANFLLRKDHYLARVVNNAKETPLHLAVTHYIDVDECKSVKDKLERLIGEERASSVIEAAVDLKSKTMIDNILEIDSCVALWHDKNGLTPLHRTTMLDGIHIVDVIRSILKHCPQSAQVYDAFGNSILHLLIGKNVSYRKLKNLLKFKEMYASRNHQNNEGNTPLHIAAINKDIDMVRALLKSSPKSLPKSSPKLGLKNKEGVSVASLFQHDLLDETRDMTSTESNAANEGSIAYFNKRMEWSEYDLLHAKDSCGRSILHKLMQMENETHTVHKDFLELIKKLIKSPQALAKQTDLKGDTPVHILVKNRHDSTLGRSGLMSKLLELYKEEAPWLAKNELGNTPIHEGIIANNTTLIEELLELYDKLTKDSSSVWLVQNVQGNTPLHLAIMVNNTAIVRQLLELYKKHASDKEPWWLIKNDQGNTLVHGALIAKNTTLARELLKYDPRVATMINAYGESPLHLIAKCLAECEQLQDEDLKSLIEAYKVATPWPDKDGKTMWHVFVLDFPLCLTRRLTSVYKDDVDFKALIKTKNNEEKTPLHLAIDHQRFEHAKLLLEFFPQVLKETDKERKTPLHQLLLNNSRHVELIEQCLELEETKMMVKELLRIQDNNRITPLHLVIYSGDFGLVKRCLNIAQEVDMATDLLNDQDCEENTLLHLAIQGRHFGFVYDLLDFAKKNNMDVDALLETQNKYGTKPSNLIGAIRDLPPKFEELFLSEPKFKGIRSVYGITKPQMNDYVNTMSVIAALLATITFTAAFTVPGGVVGDNGTPIFIREASFQVFMFFNVLTMCLSMMVLFCLLWIMATGNHRKSVMLMDFSMSLITPNIILHYYFSFHDWSLCND